MARNAVFVVTLSAASAQPVTVNYATVPGTATPPEDFTATSGTLTFAPGETSKTLTIPVRQSDMGQPAEEFGLQLSAPVNAVLADATGICQLPGTVVVDAYLDRFNVLYAALHEPANGYFGPPGGAKARTIPYHCPETLINEAPDHGHESVSETASFWVGLEAWKGALSNDWSGYAAAWSSIEANYIPSATNQPAGTYTPGSPATYQPEGDLPSAYPTLPNTGAPVGVDPLYAELQTTYGNGRMFLMHWLIDVDGVYGYHNGDAGETGVFINNYSRGLQESSFETVTHPSWEDFEFGSAYGYLPLFNKNQPVYPEAPFEYGKQWRYTCAPDAEARVIQHAYLANKLAAAAGSASSVATQDAKAKKMGDYLRYALFDKYYRKIGSYTESATSDAPYESCHYLVSWYASWGGEIPATVGAEPSWGFRIGSSEAHQGYQAPDIAYFMATGGGGYAPQSPSAGDIWLGSLYRQIEMLRWLQSPEGPIAGGVSNSWKGRYETPTDGRQNARFYGMFYTYAPVWHDPPSNNWFGFQVWGLQRSADLLLEVADKTSALAVEIRPNLEILLDRFINWTLDHATLTEEGSYSLPSTLSWVSETEVSGQTATAQNLEGVYEYLPNLDWDGTGSYAAFWNASTVPNPNLHCSVVESGVDIGVAASLSRLLIEYAEAKRRMNKFTSAIPGGSHTAQDCYTLARALLDRTWTLFKGAKGLTREEERADYTRYADPVYVPSTFNGTMPNGDNIASGATFISIRSFMEDDPDWPKIQAYIANPVEANIPTFTYHRFWAQAEYAMACAAMHHYFGDLVEAAA